MTPESRDLVLSLNTGTYTCNDSDVRASSTPEDREKETTGESTKCTNESFCKGDIFGIGLHFWVVSEIIYSHQATVTQL